MTTQPKTWTISFDEFGTPNGVYTNRSKDVEPKGTHVIVIEKSSYDELLRTLAAERDAFGAKEIALINERDELDGSGG